MSKRMLVVTTASVGREDLHDRVRAHAGREDADMRVVAPAAEISRLDWLANDEQEARAAAEERAAEAGRLVVAQD